MRFTVLAVGGTILGIVGLVLGILEDPAVKLVATLLLWSGGVMLGLVVLLVIRAAYRDVVAWLRDYFPSARRRGEIAEAAASLGLREGDVVDLDFAFGTDVGRIDLIFTGVWRGHQVDIFDCRRKLRTMGDDAVEQWSCVILPTDASAALRISRTTAGSRLKGIVGRGGVPTGDEAFDRAFRVEADADMKGEAVSLIDDRVRSRIMEDAPHGRVAIELRNHRLLYCVARRPIDERAGLLEIATRLRDAIPAR
ncbi:MAG TPA: hypothetical protein VIS26_00690 [Candidatus Limnocylindria bacterium]